MSISIWNFFLNPRVFLYPGRIRPGFEETRYLANGGVIVKNPPQNEPLQGKRM